jgi:hypothetical protein
MITLYIIVTYLVNLGMMIQSYKDPWKVGAESWLILFTSPITCPIIIGMSIADRD